jgi:uncharacterized protein YndB with AHSA1/START domain
MDDKPEFVYVTYIAAQPEQLWQALTDGEFTARYWGGLRITSDWQVGSPVRHQREDGAAAWQGEVLEADYPRRLSYTFHMLISDETRAEGPSRVTFELQPLDVVTKLTLTHDRHSTAGVTFTNTSNGWPALMSSLKSLLETGEALPFTRLGFGPNRTTL